MNESDVSSKPSAKSEAGVITVLAVAVIGAGVWWMIWNGRNSAEADAIARLRELNKQAQQAGVAQPVVLQMDSQQKHVATVYVRDNLEAVVPLVGKLHQVTEVYFADTDFDDDDVAILKGLPKLNSLILANTKITDAGVKELPLARLHGLNLSGTAISPASVDVIGKMGGLQVLKLSNTNVQDNLAPLAQLEELKWLLLSDCDLSGIGESSIEGLAQIPNLGRLTVLNSNIRGEVVDRLRAARPGLNLETGAEAGPDPLVEGNESR